MLKDYKARIKLKENCNPSYFDSRRFPIHILVAKLCKMVELGILEHIPLGWCKYAYGDLRICGDYKNKCKL